MFVGNRGDIIIKYRNVPRFRKEITKLWQKDFTAWFFPQIYSERMLCPAKINHDMVEFDLE